MRFGKLHVALGGLIRLSGRGVKLQVRERRGRTMTVPRAFGVKFRVIQNLLPVIGDNKGRLRCTMQSDVQLANVLEHFHGDGPVVTQIIPNLVDTR